MSTLTFTIPPEGISRLADGIACLAKFGENVSLQAERGWLSLTTLNSSKSAFASLRFDANLFFTKYRFVPQAPKVNSKAFRSSGDVSEEKFTCQIYNKALLSVFKGRVSGNDTRERETAVERCEVNLQDGSAGGKEGKAGCRIVVKMICRHGVVKIYRLTYEAVPVVHAIFDTSRASNSWSISSKLLREFIEYFGPRTEQLDIYSENGRATFTSYTEKISDGKEVLKTPLHTSIALETADFASFFSPDGLHIGIAVKDFKSIIIHAESLHTLVTARFSKPGRPLQLAYETDNGGMKCEFTLMTLSDSSDVASMTTATNSAAGTQRNISVPASVTSVSRQQHTPSTFIKPEQQTQAPLRAFLPETARAATAMAPPPSQNQRTAPTKAPAFSVSTNGQTPSASQRTTNKPTSSAPPPQSTLDPDSLFIPADDDRRWDEPVYGDEDDAEDMLGWDASRDNDTLNTSFGRRLQDSEPSSFVLPPAQQVRKGSGAKNEELAIPPTQRMSQVVVGPEHYQNDKRWEGMISSFRGTGFEVLERIDHKTLNDD